MKRCKVNTNAVRHCRFHRLAYSAGPDLRRARFTCEPITAAAALEIPIRLGLGYLPERRLAECEKPLCPALGADSRLTVIEPYDRDYRTGLN